MMKQHLNIFVIALILSLFVCMFNVLAETPVELTPSNLAQQLSGDSDWFIKFYSPLCHHCVKNMPVFQSFADEVSADTKLSHLKIGTMDVQNHANVRTLIGVEQYPQFFYFSAGRYVEYTGEFNTKELLLNYVSGTDTWKKDIKSELGKIIPDLSLIKKNVQVVVVDTFSDDVTPSIVMVVAGGTTLFTLVVLGIKMFTPRTRGKRI